MTTSELSNRSEYLNPLGRLVLAVADAEGAAGELIVLQHPDSIPPNGDRSRSGMQLSKALRTCSSAPNFQMMCDHFEEITPQRNLMIHGEWLFGAPESETALVLNRTHAKATSTPGYTAAHVTPEQVNRLAELFEAIFAGLGGYISDAMQKRKEDRGASATEFSDR